MRNTLILSALIGLTACLIGLAAPPSAAGSSSYVITATLLPSKITPTVMLVPTYQMGATPTPMLAEMVEAGGTCVPLSQEDVPFTEEFYDTPDSLQEQLLVYLNAGGSLENLDAVLSQQVVTFSEFISPYLWQIVTQDVTGDTIPEIFVALTIPVIPGHGDSYLFVFTCADDHYEPAGMWGRGGAGVSGEGIYEGGGTRVIAVQDLNDNGSIDLLFKIGWLWNFGDGDRPYTEYYLLEWRDAEWTSLVEEMGELGETQYFIASHTYEDLQILDPDGDNVYEIVVDGQTYRWDGEIYVAENVTPTP